jgi:hypothetical protein
VQLAQAIGTSECLPARRGHRHQRSRPGQDADGVASGPGASSRRSRRFFNTTLFGALDPTGISRCASMRSR